MAGDFFDDRELRDPEERERDLLAALPGWVAAAIADAPGYAKLYADIAPAAVTGREGLARLPVLRKSELPAIQADAAPFGGLALKPPGDASRIFASPGPIFEAEAKRHDHWRTARALYATGFRAGDVVHNCFSYHLTPAGAMFESGAHTVGCAVIPAGVGNTEMQAQVIERVRPRGYVGTPDFLKTILEKADALGLDNGSIGLAHVSGGPYLPALRSFYEGRGITVFQSYGIADLGLIAYETPAREGLVVEEDAIVEIVRPGTGDPVPEGEVGEVVVTAWNNTYPLIRLATGDLSAVLPGASPCGRTNMRVKGWMGRADQTTKVKGMFVTPAQIAAVAGRHPAIGRARLVVASEDGQDSMVLRVEAAAPEDGLAAAIAETLQAVTKLRGTVELVAPGTLPNDGKVIDDTRSYA